jgi:threonine dehydratase
MKTTLRPGEQAVRELREAAARLAGDARETPTVYSYTFSESAGCDVFLKLENLQRTGSFKLRGALNKIRCLPEAERARGLVAASAGNHAQGVALAARLAGTRAAIVMPESTPLIKVRRTEDYGAEVLIHGLSYDEAQARAHALAAERGATLVHPFDDPDVILGQGTVGLELLEQVPDLDAVVVPVGGGGLLSGIALAIKSLAPRVKVFGVQAAGADPMVRSFRGGRAVSIERPRTIADGIRVGTTAERTFELIREHVDGMLTVDEDELSRAVVETLEKSKIVAEPAGVAGVAAIGAGRVPVGGRVCAVISGGNIDLNFLGRLIEGGLAAQGYYHPLQLRMADRPGQLRGVLGVLEAEGCNVVDIIHFRSGWRVPIGTVDVEILVETRRAGQGAQLDERLRAEGYEVGGHPA